MRILTIIATAATMGIGGMAGVASAQDTAALDRPVLSEIASSTSRRTPAPTPPASSGDQAVEPVGRPPQGTPPGPNEKQVPQLKGGGCPPGSTAYDLGFQGPATMRCKVNTPKAAFMQIRRHDAYSAEYICA